MRAVPRILLAEGHRPTREYLTRNLSDEGYEVLIAEDAKRAYEIYVEWRPEAVVLSAGLGAAASLVQRLREADPGVVVVVTDRERLGEAVWKNAVSPIEPSAYVADPMGRELVDALDHLIQRGSPGRPRLSGLPLVLSRKPAAQGEVKTGVVARLLHQIWRSLSEGVLVIEDRRERWVLFLRGAPVGVESDDPGESLPRWLVESGRMDEKTCQAAIESMAGGLSPGAALIAAGVTEPGEPLQAVAREHLRALLSRCVGAREGRWRFHAGGEFAPRIQPNDVLPLQVVLEGARAAIPVKHFFEALRAVMDAYPIRTGDFQQVLPATEFGSRDLRIALSLDGRTRAREFLDARRGDLKDALSLLWFLSMVGAVAFHEAPEEGGDAVYGKAPPRKRKPLPAERAEALRQAALQILPGTYFHALGVDIAADTREVELAYQTVASRFHPDGFAEYEVGELEDLLTSVQDKLTAAFRVLSTPEKRKAYLSFLLLRFELTGLRRPGIDVDAEVALRRGERALRARRNTEAAAEIRDAAERNPREPEYLAMLGFAELFDPVLPASERAQAAKRSARRALALDPHHLRGTVALALAERAAGDVAEARRLVLGALRRHPESELAKRVLQQLDRVKA